MNHYVYLLRSEKYHYVGMRSCRCPIEDDGYMGSGVAVLNAQKNGVKFEKTVLCVTDSRKEAAALEEALVGPEQVDDEMCLNLCDGGGGGPHGRPLSPETKAKISEKLTGRAVSDKTRSRMSASRKLQDPPIPKGFRHTAETRAKISAALKGRKHSAEHVANGAAARKGNKNALGHKLSNEAKGKISSARRAHEAKKNK